jgi:hypothetical protein
VARDASGNFSAGTITAALSGNATTATTAGSITSQANSATITATSANTANQIVLRDASGNFSAGTITATLSGNATTATSVSNALTLGSYLTGTSYNGGTAVTAAVDATSANTASKVVARDASGNFSAGTITATLSGNASTATTATNQSGGTVSATTGSFSSTLTLSAGISMDNGQAVNMKNASGTSRQAVVVNASNFLVLGGTVDAGIIFNTSLGNERGRFSTAGGFSVGTTADPGAGAIYATGNITAYYSSDIKFKENVRDIPNAAATAAAIGGKLFDWKAEYLEEHGGEDGYFIVKADFGVIAQDVLAKFPVAVRTRPDGSLAVDYEKLSALALAAVAEHEDRIAKLEALVAKLIEG